MLHFKTTSFGWRKSAKQISWLPVTDSDTAKSHEYTDAPILIPVGRQKKKSKTAKAEKGGRDRIGSLRQGEGDSIHAGQTNTIRFRPSGPVSLPERTKQRNGLNQSCPQVTASCDQKRWSQAADRYAGEDMHAPPQKVQIGLFQPRDLSKSRSQHKKN